MNLNLIAFGTKVASYHEDLETALRQVLDSLAMRYPLRQATAEQAEQAQPAQSGRGWSLDGVTSVAVVDVEAFVNSAACCVKRLPPVIRLPSIHGSFWTGQGCGSEMVD